MAMRLDGHQVMKRILDNPSVFPLTNDIDAVARKFVVVRMKNATTAADLRTICSTLGAENFSMLADGISDAEAKSIIGKVDKENKEAKAAGGAVQRVLLVELATGKIDPRTKVVKEKAPRVSAARPTSGAGKGVRAVSAGAKRKTKT